jgi:hypothetical protein
MRLQRMTASAHIAVIFCANPKIHTATKRQLRVTAAPLMQSPREETNKKRGLHCGCYHATARRAIVSPGQAGCHCLPRLAARWEDCAALVRQALKAKKLSR